MKTWKVYYRNGVTTLAERLVNAVTHYQAHNAALPSAVVVNPADVGDVTAVLSALELGTLQVIGNGSTLAGEVWLQVAEKKGVSK